MSFVVFEAARKVARGSYCFSVVKVNDLKLVNCLSLSSLTPVAIFVAIFVVVQTYQQHEEHDWFQLVRHDNKQQQQQLTAQLDFYGFETIKVQQLKVKGLHVQ